MLSVLTVLGWTLGLPIVLGIGWALFCWIMTYLTKDVSWIQGGWAVLFGIIPVGAIVGLIIGIASIL